MYIIKSQGYQNVKHTNSKPKAKMVEENSNVSIITINVNGVNSLVKSKVYIFFKSGFNTLKMIHQKYKHLEKLKVWGKMYGAKC